MSTIDFEEAVPSILAADTSDYNERDPETFFASHIGFCPRQVYVNKLGLSESRQRQGQYRVARLIQNYLERRVGDRYPELETEASLRIDEGPVKFVGRCNLYDPATEIVYSLKVRNGWYKFSPPVDRHIDQLHIYMQGVGVERGKLVYFSKNDIGDIREWPPPDSDQPFVAFDDARYDGLVAKAKRIRDVIWTKGIATNEEEIPLVKCGCYFCKEESLAFPDIAATATANQAASTTDDPDHGAGNELASEAGESGEAAQSPTQASAGPSPTAKGDGGSAAVISKSTETRDLGVESTHVPRDLRELDVWVVWDGRSKVALAPWQAGTMYPCEWAASKDVDPRREFEKATMVAELPVRAIHRSWPFPDGDNLPEAVRPAVLLQHEPPEPPITFVDFDDVRDPETGEVPFEVAELVDTLGGYAEVSRSGTGLHVYVRGGLPAGVGSFIAPLSDRGTVEIYDHARFTGGRGECPGA